MSFQKRILSCNTLAKISIMLSLLSSPLYAADITGNYHCTGSDPFSKSDYTSELTITRTGETYGFKWGVAGKEFSGTGVISRQGKDFVAAEYWNPSNENNSGVVIYKITDDNTLEGDWTVSEKNLIGSETCKKEVTESAKTPKRAKPATEGAKTPSNAPVGTKAPEGAKTPVPAKAPEGTKAPVDSTGD